MLPFATGSLPSNRLAMPEREKDWRSLLTPREYEVACLVACGLGNKTIAAMLGTAEGTVKFQVHAILVKLGASNRRDLAARLARFV
jgi:two-component system, NarL family, nitrate/nitrite response regulator NarL